MTRAISRYLPRFLTIERRPTSLARLGRVGLTLVCVVVVFRVLTWPAVERAMNAAIGNQPLTEIEIGDKPGSVSFTPTSAPAGTSR